MSTTSLCSRTRTAAVIVATGLLLAGCGSSNGTPSSTGSSAAAGPSAGSSTGSSTSSSPGTTIAVTVRGNTVTPNGDRVKASVGEPVTLVVDADRAGELHVHSTPEQELEYSKGRTTLHVTIDKPGIVDVEDHVADVVVVQLEVS
jgi:hypothetical protein